MDSLEAIYFPGTEIYSASQFPVFLLFGRLHLLHPVETGGGGDDTADIFTTSGLCQAHTPCPLGDQRDRFLHLIRDIRERKDDYAAQLSSLTVASYSEKKSSVEDSSRSIMSTLLGNPVDVKSESEIEEENRQDKLWQARLILKIGEILDREEEEVAVQMALLEDDESGLFKNLQGEMDEEEETLFGELRELKSRMSRPSSTSATKRLNAWSMIYGTGNAPSSRTFLTHQEDAADVLLEKYEEQMQLKPSEILTLALPANIGWDRQTAYERIEDFRALNQELLERLENFLSITELNPEEGSLLASDWEASLVQSFPESEYGRVPIAFYRMASLSCSSLLGGTGSNAPDFLASVRWAD